MKKIGKFIKNNLFGFIIGGIIFGGIGVVVADTIINSVSVAYKTTTVKGALDELYGLADTIPRIEALESWQHDNSLKIKENSGSSVCSSGSICKLASVTTTEEGYYLVRTMVGNTSNTDLTEYNYIYLDETHSSTIRNSTNNGGGTLNVWVGHIDAGVEVSVRTYGSLSTSPTYHGTIVLLYMGKDAS